MSQPHRCWCGGSVPSEDPTVCLDSPYHDPSADGRPHSIRKLYIAGPMSGYPDCNYPEFNAAEYLLREKGFTVLNPASTGEGDSHYVDLIRKDLLMLLECDGVAVLENWWESVGARNEVQVAGILKMPVRPVGEWLLSSLYSPSDGGS